MKLGFKKMSVQRHVPAPEAEPMWISLWILLFFGCAGTLQNMLDKKAMY